MDQPALAAKIQDLNDIELALLLCIIAKQSCLLAVNGPDMVMPTSRELEEVNYALTTLLSPTSNPKR